VLDWFHRILSGAFFSFSFNAGVWVGGGVIRSRFGFLVRFDCLLSIAAFNVCWLDWFGLSYTPNGSGYGFMR
jgi:hypothetical protein